MSATKIITLAFESLGSSDRPTLIWLHGFLGAGRDWRPIAKRLPDYHHVMLDLPGHGESIHRQPETIFSFPGAARAIMATLEQPGLDTVTLIGYSMGARLALYLALRFPLRIRGLVMEGGSPGLRTEAERDERRQRDRETRHALQCQPMTEFLNAWYDQPLFHSLRNHPELLRRLRASRCNNDISGLCRAHEGLGIATQPDLWPELPRLSMPTLSIVGEQDDKYGAIARAMQSRSACIKMVTVPKCGHNTHVEDPKTFARLLSAWLAEKLVTFPENPEQNDQKI